MEELLTDKMMAKVARKLAGVHAMRVPIPVNFEYSVFKFWSSYAEKENATMKDILELYKKYNLPNLMAFNFDKERIWMRKKIEASSPCV